MARISTRPASKPHRRMRWTRLSAELSELRAAMAQEADLTALEAQIAALEPAQMPDASAIEASIEELRAQIAAIPAPVDISGLQAQIDDLTAQDPVDLGPIRDSLAALEAAYAPVPEQIAALQADMEDLRALATQEVVEAEAAVDAALASAGLDRIRAAFCDRRGICRRGGAVGAGRCRGARCASGHRRKRGANGRRLARRVRPRRPCRRQRQPAIGPGRICHGKAGQFLSRADRRALACAARGG